MNITIDANEFFQIKDISYIINSSYKLVDYEEKDDSIVGKIDFIAEYFLNNNQGIMEECFKINFTIYNENYKINELKVLDLKPTVLDNQGINVDYKINLEYEEIKKSDILEEKEELLEENIEIEVLKNEIVESIDEKLKESLIEKELYEPEEEVNEQINIIKTSENDHRYDSFINETKKSNYKIVYVKDELEIENLAKTYKKPIKDIYRDTNYDVKTRVIIKL